jgi:hypothetical protein
LEAAMKTSAESKRRLLGRVAAAAIDGSGFAKPDRYLLLIRSIDAIEPAHVQMLVILVSPQPRDADGLTGSGDEGWLTGEDIAARWEDVGDVAQVLTAVLDREGLIKIRPDLGHSGDHEKYAATEHGRLLLKHLTSEELGTTDLREAVLVPRMWYHSRGDPGYPLIVQNLGPGHARRVRVQVLHKGVVAIRGDVSPFHLDPLEEKQFWLDFGFRKWDYQVLLDWRDDRGDQHFEAILKSDVTIQVGAGSHA